jgi:pyruvate/2-oxoglutarate dehydrogenase complex dihydrolipoamide acyltransferase (E2) component
MILGHLSFQIQFRLDIGYPAMLPSFSVCAYFRRDSGKAWVVNGEIVPRTIMKLGIAIDHRVLDVARRYFV